MSKVFSVRLPDEVAEAFEVAAGERSVKPTTLLREVITGWLVGGDRRGSSDPRPGSSAAPVREVRAAAQRASSVDHEALERERLQLLAQARATVVRRGS